MIDSKTSICSSDTPQSLYLPGHFTFLHGQHAQPSSFPASGHPIQGDFAYSASTSTPLLKLFIRHPRLCKSLWVATPSGYWTITPFSSPSSLPMTCPLCHAPRQLTSIMAPYPRYSVASTGNLSDRSRSGPPPFPCFLPFLRLRVGMMDSIASTVSPNKSIDVHSAMPSAAYSR